MPAIVRQLEPQRKQQDSRSRRVLQPRRAVHAARGAFADARRLGMANWTLGYGALLIALGVGGFVATGAEHKTALIPAGFGAVAVGLGLLARREAYRRRALQGALVLALIGIGGSARGLAKLPALLAGEEMERPAAVITQSIMAGLSIAQVVACLVALRRARPS
jgi:hypothetical protein